MTFLLLVTSIPSVRLSHIHCTHKKIHVLNRNKDNKSETRDRVDWSHRGWNLRLNENTLCQCNYSTLEITAAPINSSQTMGQFHFWSSILIFIDLYESIHQKHVWRHVLKLALSQKILEKFYVSNINIPNHYPEQKIWISCLLF